ncbi:MAG: hypothetical protein KGZ83_12935 [Sulfuricella sp.]|nr:hypothetical protein [Sulfuricella sp.]
MLSLILSTGAFFVAAYFLDRYLDELGIDRNMSRKVLVGALATLISIGSGWAIDQLDDTANTSSKNASLTDVMQSGDTVQILKALSGIK